MSNTYVNKVDLADGTSIIDISDTTAVAADVASGKYFYAASGEKVAGTASGCGPSSESIAFSSDSTWIDPSTGIAEADSSFYATDYIDVTDAAAISYAGKSGSSKVIFWYNSSKTFISSDLVPDDKMIWFYNVLTLKPSGAKYLRCQSKKTTASNPPDITPEVTAFYGKNYMDLLMANIVGDGITDDTLALQRIVNMGSFVLPPAQKIKLTSTVNVCMGYSKVLDGNGANVVTNGNYYAFTVTGTLRTPAEPTTMDSYVVNSEAGSVIKNWCITANDGESGGGFDIVKAFALTVSDNYVHHTGNGIRVSGRIRDLVISGNQLFTFTANGILFDDDVNIHQCNIYGNHILFALNCINVYHPGAIANFQITGNDIEIVDYPTGYANATCIAFTADSGVGQFGEIAIVGNTIQGHLVSHYIMVFTGTSSYPIENVSIVGNHISNADTNAIKLTNAQNITISGNTYAYITQYVYDLNGTCTNITIVGESATSVGGKIHAASGATLSNIRCREVSFLTNDTNSIQTNSATGMDINDEKTVSVSGSTPSITAVQNSRYVCGTVSAISFTPCASGMCEVTFTSGSTAAALTVPNTVKWAGGFDPTSLDASTTYTLNVMDGTLGVAAAWA